MKSRNLALACALPTLLIAATPTSAAEIITDYEFQATTPGPITSHSGTFSLSFNTVTGVYSLTAINFAIGSTNFTLANAAAQAFNSGFLVYGTQNGVNVNPGTDDFFLGNYVGDFLGYGTIGGSEFNGGGQFYGQGSASIRAVNSGVPEPSTWAMLLLGFFGIGYAMRSSKARQQPAVSYS